MLVRLSAEGLGGALAMENAPHDSEFDFHVCAMIRDQASMDIAVESVFHISPALQALLSTYHNEVTAYIAGLFAVHPEETTGGNFGATCKKIEK